MGYSGSENEILSLDTRTVKPFLPRVKHLGEDFFTDRPAPLPVPDDESPKSLADKELGARIKERRNALRWTQSELDRRAGLPEGSSKVIEAGQGASDKRIQPIADALGLTVAFLRYGTPSALDVAAIRALARAEGRREALSEVQSFLVYLREHGELEGAIEAMLVDATPLEVLNGGTVTGDTTPPQTLPPAEYVPNPRTRRGRKQG